MGQSTLRHLRAASGLSQPDADSSDLRGTPTPQVIFYYTRPQYLATCCEDEGRNEIESAEPTHLVTGPTLIPRPDVTSGRGGVRLPNKIFYAKLYGMNPVRSSPNGRIKA